MTSATASVRDGTTGAGDFRLAAPALAAWVVAWQGRRVDPLLLSLLAAVLATVAVLGLARRSRRTPAVVVGLLVCSAAAGVATAARVAGREVQQVREAAESQAAVVVEAVVTDDPRRAQTAQARDLVVTRVRVESIRVGGREHRVRVPVVVLSNDAAWLGLLPSQRVGVEGRLRAPEPGDDVAAVLSGRGPPEVLSGPSVLQRVAGRARQGLRDAVAPLPDAEAGLLPGLVVGDTSRLDPQLREDFRTTGLTHLTAVSGTNVAILCGAVLLLARRLGAGVRSAPLLAGVALASFVVLARPSPSVLRAAVMGAVALVALGTGGRRAAVPALSAATLGLVLLDPDLAATPGFALSVVATAGLLLLAPTWRDGLARRVPRWLAEAIAVPAAAQVACGPVVVAISGQYGLLSVPANLLAIPAVAPATVLGVLAAVVAPVCLPLAQLVAWVGWLPTAWLVVVARTGAAVPGASVSWPEGTRGALLLLAVTAALWLVVLRRRWRRAMAAGLVGTSVAAAGLGAVAPSWPPPDWQLALCDVGQGDMTVVRGGLVVDVGPDPAAADRCLRRFGVDRVPLVVLTHQHADHVLGLPGVLRRPVGLVEVGPLAEPEQQHDRVLAWAREAGVPVAQAALGEQRRLGEATWTVVAPSRRYRGTRSDPNNSSLVLRLRLPGMTVLLTGDVEPEAQADLVAAGLEPVDVLKVPHHGSDHQDPALLAAARPRLALTSVGADNTYGHPAADTLGQLLDQGARSWRTDLDGDVAVVARAGGLVSVGRSGQGELRGPVAAALSAGPPVEAWSSSYAGVGGRGGASVDAALPAPVRHVEAPAGRVARGARAPPPPREAGGGARSSRSGVDGAALDGRGVARSGVPPKPLAALTLVVGDEDLLVARAVSRIVAAARAQEPDVDVQDLEASSLAPGDLLELFSPSLFGDRKVVVLRAAHDLGKDVAAELTGLVGDPTDDVVLVVQHAGGAKGKALLTALLGAGGERIDVPKISKAGERRDFVRRELKVDGRVVEEEAVTALLEAVGTDLRELASACSQLLSDTEGTITVEAVGRYHRGKAEASGFAVADRAVEGDLAGALELLRWGQSTGLAHVLVTSALASTLRAMAQVAAAGRSVNSYQLAAQLQMPAWKVDKSQKQSRGWLPEGLSTAVQAVAAADADVKGGAADQDYAVERALLAVVQARGEGR